DEVQPNLLACLVQSPGARTHPIACRGDPRWSPARLRDPEPPLCPALWTRLRRPGRGRRGQAMRLSRHRTALRRVATRLGCSDQAGRFASTSAPSKAVGCGLEPARGAILDAALHRHAWTG